MSAHVKLNINAKGVARLRLDRTDKRNAFDDQSISELREHIERINSDDGVRVLVLEAAGDVFSAGADVDWMHRMANYNKAENEKDALALAQMLDHLDRLNKPSIARVQGSAFGGAIGLISCCDIAIAVPQAKFCFSEVKLGLVPATISPYVIAAIGARAARRYFTTAEVFDAEVAKAMGLITTIAETDELDNVVDHFVQLFMANGPQAIALSKSLIDLVYQGDDEGAKTELLEKTSQMIAGARVSSEGQEGLSAFLKKHKPSWQRNDQ